METFEFNTSIDVFQFQLKYGINKNNVYVADIKQLTNNNESVEV